MQKMVPFLYGILWLLSVSDESLANEQLKGPVFVSVPPSRFDYSEDRGGKLTCSVFGNPTPAIQWVDTEGVLIESQPNIRTVDSNGTITFHRITTGNYTSSAGIYRCIARNAVGSIRSPDIRINAVVSQPFTVQLQDKHVMLGNTVVFKCEVPAFAKDYVTVTSWSRSGTTIVAGGRFSIFPWGELHIRDARVEDKEYQYSCSTRNTLLQTTKSSDFKKLTLAVPVNIKPEIIDSVVEHTISIGEEIELPCAASGHPSPEYQWTKDGSSVTLSERITLRRGNLVVSNAVLDDGGSYQCTAENNFGSNTVSRNLVVREPIVVSFYPQKRTVDIGAFATFNCSVTGHPIEEVTWYKNAQPLDEDERVTVYSNGTMVVAGMHRNDRGMYQCVASNMWETQEATMQLSLGAATPTFLSHFTNQTLSKGPNLSLHCTVAGNPTPTIAWYRDGELVTNETNTRYSQNYFTNLDGDVTAYLNITSLKNVDGGLYRCAATSELGIVFHEDRINVIGNPYIRPIANVTAVAGTTVVVHCRVAGYPITLIRWLKNSLTLPLNIRQTVLSNGTMIIRDVTKRPDEGLYSCRASNNQGIMATKMFHLTVQIPPEIAPFANVTLTQGERTQLLCTVNRGDTPMNITWYKDGEDIPPGHGIQIHYTEFSSTLGIADASVSHEGSYTCEAQNHAASATFTGYLTVNVMPAIIVRPTETEAVFNGSVQMPCSTSGKPKPTIVWKIRAKGQTLFQNINLSEERFELLPNGTLSILQVREEDEGLYMCHIFNDVGEDGQSAQLTVYIPARFDIHEQNQTVSLNSSITLTCAAYGNGPLELQWYKNGVIYEALEIENQYEISTAEGSKPWRSTLTIYQSQRDDTALYKCTAFNKHGEDESFIQLFVQEAPEAPVDLRVISVSNRNVTIAWQLGFDGNSPHTGFSIEYKNDSDAWQGGLPTIHLPNNFTVYEYTISRLHAAYTYNVRISAFNGLGISPPSEEILFTTLEEAPSGPPLHIEAVALTSQSIKVTWRQPRADLQNGILNGYTIRYRDKQTPFQSLPASSLTGYIESCTLEQLNKFTEYTIQLKAYNSEGEGPWSPEVVIMTMEDVPDQPPSSVAAMSSGSTGISVYWQQPPLESLNGVLQNFLVYYQPVRENEDENDVLVYSTEETNANIFNLQKFTNYSVSVAARTSVGEGIRSDAIYVRTEQDTPEAPADIKAYAASADPISIMVSWLPPLSANGILTKYRLTMQYVEGESPVTREMDLSPDTHYHLITDLKEDYNYDFWVQAATEIGLGVRSRTVTEVPEVPTPARIMSFPSTVVTPWRETVLLDCLAVGEPDPTVEWRKSGSVELIRSDDHIRLLGNGSLLIENVQPDDAGTYSCMARNEWNSPDEIDIEVQVLAPPFPPEVSTSSSTSNSITIQWKPTGNGGSPIREFQLFYKMEHAQEWSNVRLNSTLRSLKVEQLQCGTKYKFYMTAENILGVGQTSDEIAAATKGSVPVPPSDDEVVPFTNATSITVFLSTWRSGGCPIQHFSIEYKNSSDNVWIKASTNYPSTNPIYTIRGLRPLTWFDFQVTAVNSAGPSVHQFTKATTAIDGETVPSITPSQEHPKVLPFLDDPKKYVPVVGLMTIILFGIFLGYFVFQRRERLQKEREKARLAAAIAERERHSSLNSSPRRHDVINGNPMTPEREPFLGTPVRIEHPLPSRQSPWVFHTDGSQEVDVNCNGRPDTYGGYGYRGSYRRSLATFRTDEEGSDSLSDLGAAAPHIRERVYDQPPVERSISTHTYARLDDFHGVPPAVPGRPVQFFTSDHASGNSSHAQPDSETSASQQDEKPPSLNSIGTNTSSNREELERLYANACRLQQMNYQSPHSSTQYSSSQSHSSPSKNYDRPPRRSRESRDSRHRRQSSKGRITGEIDIGALYKATSSDLEAGIVQFTESPPLESVPESGITADKALYSTVNKPGGPRRQHDRPIYPATTPPIPRHYPATTSPSPIHSSEDTTDHEPDHGSSDKSFSVHRPITTRYRPNRRGPRRGYVGRPIIRAGRAVHRRYRYHDSRRSNGTPSSSSEETTRPNSRYRDPSSPSEGYMSFPYDSLSAAYSGVTDSDPEPRKPYLIAYKYDRRKIRDKGSISEPERGRNLTGFNPIPKVMHPETRYHLPAQYLKPRNKYPVNFRTFPREGCFQPLKNTFDVPPVRDAAHRDILEEELQIKDSSEEAKSKEDIQMEDLSEENDVEEVPMLKKDEPAPPRHPCEGLTVV